MKEEIYTNINGEKITISTRLLEKKNLSKDQIGKVIKIVLNNPKKDLIANDLPPILAEPLPCAIPSFKRDNKLLDEKIEIAVVKEYRFDKKTQQPVFTGIILA